MDESSQSTPEDFYSSDSEATEAPEERLISWSASEFLHHQKTPAWYFFIMLFLAVVSLLLYVLTRDIIGPISVMILGILLLVGGSRKPRTVEYRISSDGITVGSKAYLFDDFQSFSLVREDQIESIALYPHKRFIPVVSLYFAPDDGQKIFDVLSDFLPFEQRERDQIDKFLHKIRF